MNIGQSLDRLGNSVINLSTSMYQNQEAERIQQEQEMLRVQAEDQAIQTGTMRNQFTARSREVFREMDGIMGQFSNSQDMKNFDIGGHWATQRDQIRNDLLTQYENDPQLQAKMQIEIDANLLELDNQFYQYTSTAYQTMLENETNSNFNELAENGDFVGIDQYTQSLLEPIGDAENQTLAGLVDELKDLYKQNDENPNELVQARIAQLEDQRVNLEDQIKGSRNDFYTASDILAKRDAALKGASLSVIQRNTQGLIPTAAEDYILNGDDEYLNRFTKAERDAMAQEARQTQTQRMNDLSVQNTQRYYDGFNQIRTPAQAQSFLSTVTRANNGVYENGQITPGYVNQGVQQQLINATNAMIDNFILQDARAAEAAQNQANAQRQAEIETEKANRLNAWTSQVGAQQIGYVDALNQLDNLLREGVIDATGYRTNLNLLESKIELPNVRAGYSRIDSLYNPDRYPGVNAEMRDKLEGWISGQISQAGNGFQSVAEFTNEQIIQVIDNFEAERRQRISVNRLGQMDVRNSLMNEDGRNLFWDRKNSAEAFTEMVDQNRFLGIEDNEEFRNIAVSLGTQTVESINQMLRGDIRLPYSDLIAPQGTQVPTQNLIVGTGLRTQVFVETPYNSRYSQSLPDGRRGLVLTNVYNPESGDNELAVLNSDGRYLPLSLSSVRSELTTAKTQFTINQARENRLR